MKKLNFFVGILLVSLSTVSCSHDDVITEDVVSQKVTSSKPNINARFTAQNRAYSATFQKDYVFNNISLNGNNTLQISVSNTGTAAANMDVFGNNGTFFIGTKLVPNGGAYYTYTFPVTGMSGNVVVKIGSSVAGGTVIGNLQLSSF